MAIHEVIFWTRRTQKQIKQSLPSMILWVTVFCNHLGNKYSVILVLEASESKLVSIHPLFDIYTVWVCFIHSTLLVFYMRLFLFNVRSFMLISPFLYHVSLWPLDKILPGNLPNHGLHFWSQMEAPLVTQKWLLYKDPLQRSATPHYINNANTFYILIIAFDTSKTFFPFLVILRIVLKQNYRVIISYSAMGNFWLLLSFQATKYTLEMPFLYHRYEGTMTNRKFVNFRVWVR